MNPNDPDDKPGAGSDKEPPAGASGPEAPHPSPPGGTEGGQREHWMLPGQLPDAPLHPRPPGEPRRPPAPPLFNRPDPQDRDPPERTSLFKTFLKVIGWLILGVVILIALAFGTCLLLVMTHK